MKILVVEDEQIIAWRLSRLLKEILGDKIELLELVATTFQTVVVSAHTERAIAAFQYGVLDFVGKPFDRERLELSLTRFLGGARVKEQATRYLSIKQVSGMLLNTSWN